MRHAAALRYQLIPGIRLAHAALHREAPIDAVGAAGARVDARPQISAATIVAVGTRRAPVAAIIGITTIGTVAWTAVPAVARAVELGGGRRRGTDDERQQTKCREDNRTHVRSSCWLGSRRRSEVPARLPGQQRGCGPVVHFAAPGCSVAAPLPRWRCKRSRQCVQSAHGHLLIAAVRLADSVLHREARIGAEPAAVARIEVRGQVDRRITAAIGARTVILALAV